jgi:hypothetical protein
MATTYAGNTQVRSGIYFNRASFQLVNVEKDGGTLPGGPAARFLRIPVVVAMLAAPALGGLFVVALPFIGFGVLGHAVARAVTGGAKEVAATVATPAMPAGSTALTGKPTEKGAAGEPASDAATEALAREIEAKRGGHE